MVADEAQAVQVPPVYTELKDLHLNTELMREGKPNATIVVPRSGIYDAVASRMQVAIEARSGVRVPIATDDAPEGAVPIGGNLIALGNRSTNRTIEALYNRYYTLLDLRYPGAGGAVVRSLHNPFGDGHNVIFVGGSDAVGVGRATDLFIRKLAQAEGGDGTLSVGWLMEIRLGRGIELPEDIREFETWEASAGYGSVGYFGWNSISKRMAMYYMTGDPFHAREALRLAFPDDRRDGGDYGDRRGADREQGRAAERALPLQCAYDGSVLGSDRRKPGVYGRRAVARDECICQAVRARAGPGRAAAGCGECAHGKAGVWRPAAQGRVPACTVVGDFALLFGPLFSEGLSPSALGTVGGSGQMAFCSAASPRLGRRGARQSFLVQYRHGPGFELYAAYGRSES